MKAPGPNAYLQTKVMTANPAELRLMLFEGAIRFAKQAKDGLVNRDFETAFTGVTRCQNILLELINGLRPDQDPELCNRLSGLYTYMYTRLMLANREHNPAMVDEVLKLLHFEHETWSMLLDQLAAENRAAANATELPQDVSPACPPNTESIGTLIGATVSLRG